MPKQSNYWSAWLAGWLTASRAVLEAQQRMLEQFLPHSRRDEAEAAAPVPAPAPATQRQVEAALPATAGDKPSPVRRSRPSKQRTRTAPKRRGGQPKKSRGSRE